MFVSLVLLRRPRKMWTDSFKVLEFAKDFAWSHRSYAPYVRVTEVGLHSSKIWRQNSSERVRTVNISNSSDVTAVRNFIREPGFRFGSI
jgi:hypothetical protein